MNRPLIQAIAVLAIATLVMLTGWLINRFQPENADPLFCWSIGGAFLLFFAMMNSILSLRADSFMRYWQASMYSYTLLALGSALVAWGLSGIPIKEAGSYRWIYLVISIGFIVFLTMVNFMKAIVKFAEKEEWNQPRRK